MAKPKRNVARACRIEVTAPAPIEWVWPVVADVTRTGEWSHECLAVSWVAGATSAAPGARFRGRNRSGWLRWTRTCEILDVESPRRIAWRTIPTRLFVDSTDWCITLEPDGSGTRIVQSFQVTRCPDWWEWLVARVNAPHVDRRAALTNDLHRIGEVAAADARADRTAKDPPPPRRFLGTS